MNRLTVPTKTEHHESDLIEVERLTRTFGTHVALAGVTFGVPRGTVVGLLGKNGAGKSTTLRLLAGVVRPDSGRIVLDGIDSADAPRAARQKIGYLPESAPLYPELRVEEHLFFRAAQKGIRWRERAQQVKRALSLAGAWHLRDVRCGHLSRGLRQRVGLADALLPESPILLLDEPTAGLDPNQTRETRETIRKLGETCTIIVSTHILAEVDALCESAIVIDRGRVVAHGTVSELHALGQSSRLFVTFRASPEQVELAISDCAAECLSRQELAPGVQQLELGCPAGTDIDTLAEIVTAAAARRGIAVREVQRRTASLDQVFAELTEPEERC
jgi:ABC-2 type transport system ATP-binding protein